MLLQFPYRRTNPYRGGLPRGAVDPPTNLSAGARDLGHFGQAAAGPSVPVGRTALPIDCPCTDVYSPEGESLVKANNSMCARAQYGRASHAPPS